MTILANTILNADCIKALPMLPDRTVHFILTDPPYIARYRARDGRTVINDDNRKWLKPAFA
jgi:DNA modification methylase